MVSAEQAGLFAALKRVLKARGITYAQLAGRLGRSEPSIKRLFQQQDCKLSLLLRICDAAEVSIAELVESAERPPQPGAPLPPATEQALARSPSLFFFLLFLLDRFTPQQIGRSYGLSKGSVVLYLRDLERLEVLDLLPGNRVRLRIPLPVQWSWEGPLGPLLKRINQDFLAWTIDHRDRSDVSFVSITRRMRPETGALLQQEVDALLQKYRQLSHLDQLMSPDSDLIGVKWTSALAPFGFRELGHIAPHPEDPAAARSSDRAPV